MSKTKKKVPSPSSSSLSEKQWVDTLCRWYEQSARPLPWRKHKDPYVIWISEVMLQQTQVTTVLPYFERFLARFPTLQALAKAPTAEVLNAWSGLGYYSRARNLQRGAQYLVATHSGKMPRTRDDILKVPGIGPYTAGAILSIAYELPVPLVDGNVQRVFARYVGIDTPLEARATQKRFWEKAERTVSLSQSPSIYNQALMELGATVCIKANPHCSRCPVSKGCFAREHGRQKDLPAKKKKKDRVNLYWQTLVFEKDGALFLKKNQKGEWWSDLWDFPRLEATTPDEAAPQFEALCKKYPSLKKFQTLGGHKHTVTHHRIQISPLLIRLKKKTVPWEGQWIDAHQVETLPVSSLVKKVMRSYLDREKQMTWQDL